MSSAVIQMSQTQPIWSKMSNPTALVQTLELLNILLNDDLPYGDNVEQLTFFCFSRCQISNRAPTQQAQRLTQGIC